MPSNALAYFERITTDPNPAAFLAGLKDGEIFKKEDTHLEFKAGAAWNNTLQEGANKKGKCGSCGQKIPSALNHLRAIWSECLGSFANSDGGVLVWGIIAEGGTDPKTGLHTDDVKKSDPVQNPAALKERLSEWLLDATNPPLAGVRIESYLSEGKKNEGFVVCYIPQGPQRPYRSEFQGPNYYMRYTGGSEIIMPSYLRQLFYPKASHRAILTLRYIGEQRGILSRDQHRELMEFWEFEIRNAGPITLKKPHFSLKVNFDYKTDAMIYKEQILTRTHVFDDMRCNAVRKARLGFPLGSYSVLRWGFWITLDDSFPLIALHTSTSPMDKEVSLHFSLDENFIPDEG